ncbi:helix-turn-helix domain-containing protein [Aerococcus kribbianus]|uniref:Helix-turn-helix transcriptional regulator n=1 Tax=Aerococcus kribbianus TaxID=2999064 RepID=A0A9X3FQR9_9LACT|nr:MULTISPECIES: helix-turn-helix transcriptional regulator [unclassified Aerococcus]MCZ0717857.1 helix-turn-helix transcriptional regulator [Aerococcus sp. YH-aer221]MCZ0726144.1 helix-turn-helix transcriptional regulator [Aerococcus sp. YH-aer222]
MKIKELLQKSGKTLNKISTETGIVHSKLYKIKNGQQQGLKLQDAFKLADALGVDINEFREEDKK